MSMDHDTSKSLPREEHRRPDEIARDAAGGTIGATLPLSQREEHTYSRADHIPQSPLAPDKNCTLPGDPSAPRVVPKSVENLAQATDELSDLLRQMAADAADDATRVHFERLLSVHHAVCEGLAEIRQWRT